MQGIEKCQEEIVGKEKGDNWEKKFEVSELSERSGWAKAGNCVGWEDKKRD